VIIVYLQVAKIDVKQETPVDHGEIICFSIYSGPEADIGNGKSIVWVDVLDGGGRDLLDEFAPFFEDPSIKKVSFFFFNFSFKCLCGPLDLQHLLVTMIANYKY
jgi:DNA polymerase-1